MKDSDVKQEIERITETRAEFLAKQRSNVLVIAMIGKAESDLWWNSPNRAFDMRTPIDMWDEDYKRVYNYLMHHAFVGGGS